VDERITGLIWPEDLFGLECWEAREQEKRGKDKTIYRRDGQ